MARLTVLTALAGALLALAPAPPPAAAVPGRSSLNHGTTRQLCRPVVMRRWPGGPVVGDLAAGAKVRRYSFHRAWALGYAVEPPRIRGYVPGSAFCPPGRRARAALARARRYARRVGPGLGRGRPLAAPVLRRVCASRTWVRDRPYNRAIGILWRGEGFRADRAAVRSAHAGGRALGHERRLGWVPTANLCRGLEREPPGTRVVPAGDGVELLVPPARVTCAHRVSGRPLVLVGARRTPTAPGRPPRVAVTLDAPPGAGPADDARVMAALRGERATTPDTVWLTAFRGPAGDRAALGPLGCHRELRLTYRVLGGGVHRFAVAVGDPSLAGAVRRGVRAITARAGAAR